MIYRLPLSSPSFATTVDNVHGSSAIDRVQLRAERDAATSTVRDLVREEAHLTRLAGDQPDELRRVRTRIDAYCADYTGLDALVDVLRRRHHVPSQSHASLSA